MPAPSSTPVRIAPLGEQGTQPRGLKRPQLARAFGQRAVANLLQAKVQEQAQIEAVRQHQLGQQLVARSQRGVAADTAATGNLISAQQRTLASMQVAQRLQSAIAKAPTSPGPNPDARLRGGTAYAGEVPMAQLTVRLPKWYKPDLASWHGATLESRAMVGYQAASHAVGFAIPLTSSYRSLGEQRALYNRLHGKSPVAYPGSSYHEAGLAVDIDIAKLSQMGLLNQARQALYRAGWVQFNPRTDPEHFSYIVRG